VVLKLLLYVCDPCGNVFEGNNEKNDR